MRSRLPRAARELGVYEQTLRIVDRSTLMSLPFKVLLFSHRGIVPGLNLDLTLQSGSTFSSRTFSSPL
jgi:hypothetical protein